MLENSSKSPIKKTQKITPKTPSKFLTLLLFSVIVFGFDYEQ